MSCRGLSGLFALSWLVVPGFGLIDLSVTWNADWPQVLEAGWGLFATVIVGAAFVRAAFRPRSSVPALAQLVVAALALAISAVAAKEIGLLAFAVLLALQTAIVGSLAGAWSRRRDSSAPRSFEVFRPLVVVGVVGAVPWLAYALHMWALNRQERSDSDITLGLDHYSVQGALGLALGALPLMAALSRDARPFVPLCAGVAAFYLALVSFAWPSSPGGLDRAWSVAALVWAPALLAGALLADRASTAPPLQPEGSGGLAEL